MALPLQELFRVLEEMMYLLKITLIFLICFLLLSLWAFYQVIFPFRIFSSVTPKQFGMTYENISFYTHDKVLIKGWLILAPRPTKKTIILLHGYPADKGDILPSRYFLHPTYNLLFIDFRYLGESKGKYSTVGKNEVLDVLAAIDFLKQRKLDEIGLWGFSLGGAVALMSASQSSYVKAVIAESSYADLETMSYDYLQLPLLKYPLAKLLRFWGLLFLGYDIKTVSPVISTSKLTIPVLLIFTKNDEVIPFHHAEKFQHAVGNKPNVKFLIWDNLQHGQAASDYQNIIKSFFDKNL